MSEVLPDERFIELFGNELFRDLTPEENADREIAKAKKSYLGIRPLEFNTTRADKFMWESENVPALDYFAVLPAVLRAFTEDHSQIYFAIELNNFLSLGFELDPAQANVPRLKEMFAQLGFRTQHIEYIILMLKHLRKQIGLEDIPQHKPDNIEKALEAALNAAIECFGLVL